MVVLAVAGAYAQSGSISGTAMDETRGILPGVFVELRVGNGPMRSTVTDGRGDYRFDEVAPGPARLSFTLIHFATSHRDITVSSSDSTHLDVVLHLAVNADITVTGKRTFNNLADVERPAEDLVGHRSSREPRCDHGRAARAAPAHAAG